ncbi:MAG: metal ABC transporter solute-binding protein, Zn/Mn family [Thiotrichales bacterium]
MPNAISTAWLTLLLLFLPAAAGALTVVTSLPPQGFVVERVAGTAASVTVLVGPGQNPHTFEPTARQIAAVAQADVYYRIGIPVEDALLSKLRSINRTMRVIDAREIAPVTQVGLSGGHANHHHGHGPDDPHHDPHLWTDPLNVARMAEQVATALSARDPERAADYQANAARLVAELQALDDELQALLRPLRQRVFLVYHPAWDHFAARYGLEQLAMEHEGKSPGPRHLARLIERARALQLRVLFVQPQMQTQDTQTLAEAIGARRVVIDPLAPDYIDNLRRVARAIADAAP